MISQPTTLGYEVDTDLPVYVQEAIRRCAQRAEAAHGTEARMHVAALDALRGHVGGCGTGDPRMWALQQMQGVRPNRDSNPFEPGKEQSSLLSRLGADAAAPVLDVSLNEFVAAGVADTIELLNGRVGEANSEREKAEAELKEFSERAQRCDAAEAELSQARQEIEETSQKCRELEANLEYLESRYSNRIDAAPAEPKSKKPRRTRVEDEEGVYFRETPDGRVFEIGYADAERKQRWKTVGPDLEEAVALRKELAGKPHQTREAVTA